MTLSLSDLGLRIALTQSYCYIHVAIIVMDKTRIKTLVLPTAQGVIENKQEETLKNI